MITLETTLSIERFETEREANAFRDGFFSALDHYGIHKDGVITIGCLETPIKRIKADFIGKLAKAIVEARLKG